MFLTLAVDLGDRLMGAFSSPTGIPWSRINLATRTGIPDRDNNRVASLAEAGSLQLELKYLSHLTGDYTYWKAAEKVTEIIKKQSAEYGIAPIFISPDSGQFVASEIRLGSRGDSYYEYLLKQWLQTVSPGGLAELITEPPRAGLPRDVRCRDGRDQEAARLPDQSPRIDLHSRALSRALSGR